jgi:hypothetical protein
MTASEVLRSWLRPRLSPDAFAWLDAAAARTGGGNPSDFYLAFGSVPRKTGRADLTLTPDELNLADATRPGWDARTWTVDQAARTLLVLALPSEDAANLVSVLDTLFAAGEVGELVGLYQSLPVLPHPAAHAWRAREGVRTNMKAVFCAVAHRNPYPAEHLDENAFNQMVLKCLFIGVPLDPVSGLDRRANPALARMLVDYAKERWAAKRPVSAELWRPVGPFADDAGFLALERAVTTGTPTERDAAALALSVCPDPRAPELLRQEPAIVDRIRSGDVTWAKIAGSA